VFYNTQTTLCQHNSSGGGICARLRARIFNVYVVLQAWAGTPGRGCRPADVRSRMPDEVLRISGFNARQRLFNVLEGWAELQCEPGQVGATALRSGFRDHIMPGTARPS
jgi:hypothetical protein